MANLYDKFKSIGCLLGGVGLCLLGTAAVIAALALFRMGSDFREAIGLAGGSRCDFPPAPAASNSGSTPAEVPGGTIPGLEGIDLTGLVGAGADPGKAVESLNRILEDPVVRKQMEEFMASEFVSEQVKGLFGGVTSVAPQSTGAGSEQLR